MYRVVQFNRTFDFSILASILPNATAEKVAETLTVYFQSFARKTACGRYIDFIAFVKWLSGIGTLVDELRAHSTSGEIKPHATWCECVTRRVAVLRNKYGARYTTLAESLGNLYLCLEALHHSGIAPKIVRHRLPKNYHLTAKRRSSLSELQGAGHSSELVLQQIQKTYNSLIGADESDEAYRYTASLASIIPHELAIDEVSFAEALQQHNLQLLRKIRCVAEEKFIYWRQQYLCGQELMEVASTDVDIKLNNLLSAEVKWVEVCKALPLNNRNLATGRLLKAFISDYQGRVPSENEVPNKSRYQKILRHFGGRPALDAMLTAHPDAVAAALLIYLCDSGSNVSTALELTTEFEEPTDDPNIVRVCSIKPRAGNAPIIDSLPIRDPKVKVTAVEALRAIRDMTEERRRQFPEMGNMLWIFTYFSKPSKGSAEFLLNRTRYIIRDAGLQDCFLPSSIRMSVVLDVAMRSEGNLRAVNAVTKHRGVGVTDRYTQSWPVKLILTRRIREFQTHLQSALVYDIEEGFEKLGVSPIEGERLYEQAMRTGIGISCTKHSFQNESISEVEPCSKVGLCLNCERKLLLVDEHNLAELIALKSILTQEQAYLESEQKTRWEKVWVNLLAYATVAIEQVERSHHTRLLPSAQNAAEALLASGYNPLLLRPL